MLPSSLLWLTCSLSWEIPVFQPSFEISHAVSSAYCEGKEADSFRAGVLPWSRQGCNLPPFHSTLLTIFFHKLRSRFCNNNVITAVQCSHTWDSYKDCFVSLSCTSSIQAPCYLHWPHSFPWWLPKAVCSHAQVDFVPAPLAVSSNVWKQPCLRALLKYNYLLKCPDWAGLYFIPVIEIWLQMCLTAASK